ncbi:zinc knuckle CX2CX4HX4C containing protein [Tanacetum coccineum]
MEQGFLNRSYKATKKTGGDTSKAGSLLSGMAKKVKNIDGKILGKDGKPLKAYRCFNFVDNPKDATDNAHAVVGNANADEESIPTVNVGIENGGGASPNAACNGQNEDTCGPDNNPFASMLKDINPLHTVHLTKIKNDVEIVGVNVAIPHAVLDMISARFVNTLYGYFIGKRLAFPVVENDVKHAWAKYGLERVMLHQGFFMFQFSSKEGMDSVMKNGPWRISSFARALVEISADNDFVESLVVGFPYVKRVIRRYNWSAQRKGRRLSLLRMGMMVLRMLSARKKEQTRLLKRNTSKLRRNLDKLMEEEKVLDINTDDGLDNIVEPKDSLLKTNEALTSTKLVIKDDMVNDKGSIWERFKEVKRALTSDMKDESDEDEVYMSDDDMSKYISLTGGGFTMEDDDLDCYDGYEAQIYDLPEQMQAFRDHYDIRLNSHVKK